MSHTNNWICWESWVLLQQCPKSSIYRSGYLGNLKANLTSENWAKRAPSTSAFPMFLVTRFPQFSEKQACILLNLPFAGSALIKIFLVFTSLTSHNSAELWLSWLHSCICRWCLCIPPKSLLLTSAYFLFVSAQTQASCPAMLTWHTCLTFRTLQRNFCVLWGGCPCRSTSNFTLQFPLSTKTCGCEAFSSCLNRVSSVCFSWSGDLEHLLNYQLCQSVLLCLLTSSLTGSSLVPRQSFVYSRHSFTLSTRARLASPFARTLSPHLVRCIPCLLSIPCFPKTVPRS